MHAVKYDISGNLVVHKHEIIAMTNSAQCMVKTINKLIFAKD